MTPDVVPTFFCKEFGWGNNWPAEHKSVTQVREFHKISLFLIFSMVNILRDNKCSWANIWIFFIKRVVPSVPTGNWDSKKFQYVLRRFLRERTNGRKFFMLVI